MRPLADGYEEDCIKIIDVDVVKVSKTRELADSEQSFIKGSVDKTFQKARDAMIVKFKAKEDEATGTRFEEQRSHRNVFRVNSDESSCSDNWGRALAARASTGGAKRPRELTASGGSGDNAEEGTSQKKQKAAIKRSPSGVAQSALAKKQTKKIYPSQQQREINAVKVLIAEAKLLESQAQANAEALRQLSVAKVSGVLSKLQKKASTESVAIISYNPQIDGDGTDDDSTLAADGLRAVEDLTAALTETSKLLDVAKGVHAAEGTLEHTPHFLYEARSFRP